MRWAPIRYHEFYDIPRLFVAEHAGAVYVFDCQFDEESEEYPERYQVYRLPPELMTAAAVGSWEDLVHVGSFVREVPVEAVLFDATRRAAIDDSVFDEL